MNDKFLPIGGTDMWSNYPVPTPLGDYNDGPFDVPAASQEYPASTGTGGDRMIGSPRPAGAPAADWMIGSPRPARDPALVEPGDHGPQVLAEAEEALNAAQARYDSAVAALDEHSYDLPFSDGVMAPPL